MWSAGCDDCVMNDLMVDVYITCMMGVHGFGMTARNMCLYALNNLKSLHSVEPVIR